MIQARNKGSIKKTENLHSPEKNRKGGGHYPLLGQSLHELNFLTAFFVISQDAVK